MPQDASAGQSKRSPGPSYVYGPVYQFPPESEGESDKGKPKNNADFNYLVPVLIIILVIGGVVIFLKENGIDIRRLSYRRSFSERRMFNGADEDRRISAVFTHARVAADNLY